MTLRTIELAPGADLEGFRRAVRGLIGERVPPQDVVFETASAPGLFADAPMPDAPPVTLPRPVTDLVRLVVCHRDPERYGLLYTLIWRVMNGERHLLEVASDPLIARLELMAKTIRRDLHKMHAFLRFRRIEAHLVNGQPKSEERYVAWFEPDNFILEATAQFFVDRFRSLNWSILTPVGSLHWNRKELTIGPPARREDAPAGDTFEDGWRTYYESTFNPARINPTMMRQEMPKKYWRNMPEAAAIPDLVRNAPSRVREMIEREAAMPMKRNPDKAVAAMWTADEPKTLDELNAMIRAAEPFVKGGKRAVLGEGPTGAAFAFVGEQPGDQEDRAGRPFVGPAGQILDRALEKAGIDRTHAYVTNAVKHFKHEERGKRRIHQKPTAGEVRHYRWWLEKELDFVKPRFVVALGATAVLGLTGTARPVMTSRGPADLGGRPGLITVHPSFLLRLPDRETADREFAAFVSDLTRARELASDFGVGQTA